MQAVPDAAPPRTATKEEIIDMHAKIEDLRIAIARRAHGGADVQGRYKRHDTARKVFIETVALPDLRLGKLPTADDERMLFAPADDDVDGEQRREIDAWADQHQCSSSTASYGQTFKWRFPEHVPLFLALRPRVSAKRKERARRVRTRSARRAVRSVTVLDYVMLVTVNNYRSRYFYVIKYTIEVTPRGIGTQRQ